MKRTNQFKWLASGALLLAAMILPSQMKAQDAVVRTTLDEHDTPVDKGFATLAEALDEGVSGPTTFTLNADQVLSDGFTDSNYSDITFDLNGYTIDARYIRYEEDWDDDLGWVENPSKPYTSYRSFDITGNLTIKNGTLKANICGTGDTKVFLLNNATIEGDDFSWQPATGIAIENGSTFSLNNYWGSGNFSFEKCTLDATSQVKLTGINSIGYYGNTPGGYRDILHRLQLPSGYVLKQPYSDFNFAIYQTSDLENKANMKDITLTIKGSDALTACTTNVYIDVPMHNEDYSNYWTDYSHACQFCHTIDEASSVRYDEESGEYKCEHFTLTDAGGMPSILLYDEDYGAVRVGSFYAKRATYSRKMTNEWGTLCVPFGFTVSESDTYSLYYVGYDAITADAVILTQVKPGDVIEDSGRPFIVKRGASDDGFTITATATDDDEIDTFVKVSDGEASWYGVNSCLIDQEKNTGYYLDANDSKLHSVEAYCSENGVANLTIPAFRVWFDITVPSGARSLNMITDETSALSALSALTQGTAEIFDLNGNRLNDLQQGVNIVNGMKVIVR